MSPLYVHVFRSGEIDVSSDEVIDGAICIASGAPDVVRDVVGVLARHGYADLDCTDDMLLVPGMPEASCADVALNALGDFQKILTSRLKAAAWDRAEGAR